MNTDHPLVSIVIPMYQVEQVFSTCLDNLLQQTYRPLEVLMLNDASTDRTAELIEQAEGILSEHGITLKAYHGYENAGVAVMRNKGFDLATGEYLYSYDADDYLHPHLIERLVETALAEHADMVTCDWFLRYKNNDRRMYQPKVSSGTELFEQLCYGTTKWNVWLYLVRRSLFEGQQALRYQAGNNMGEDMMMTCMLALRAERVATLSEPLYYYVKTNESAQTANYKEEHWQQVDRNLRSLEAYVLTYKPQELPLLNFLKLNLKLPLLISSNKADYKHWETWYPEANVFVMQNPYLSIRTKLLQRAATLRLWGLVSLYHRVVMQWLYSILYK